MQPRKQPNEYPPDTIAVLRRDLQLYNLLVIREIVALQKITEALLNAMLSCAPHEANITLH